MCIRDRFRSNCLIYCQSITYLIGAYTPGRAYFNWTPKSHLIMHYAECSQWIHPRLGSCYAGEELIGARRGTGKQAINCFQHGSSPLAACHVIEDGSRCKAMETQVSLIDNPYIDNPMTCFRCYVDNPSCCKNMLHTSAGAPTALGPRLC